jgi:sorting nexin-1/2
MLFTKLHEEYPGVIVPPCPEKNQLEKFRKSGTFIEQRRQALEVFINKVCGHRILKHSDLLRLFLEADETAWQMEMQKLKSGPDNGSLLGKVSQFASDIVHSTKNLTKGQSDDQGEDAEYLQVCRAFCMYDQRSESFVHLLWIPCESRLCMCGGVQYKEYATHLDHHLKDACCRSADFVSRQGAYGEALAAFAQQAASMSKLEDGPAANAFLELHAAASAIASEHANSQPHMNRIFAAPMKEQHLAMRSLKDTMHARSCALGHKVQAEAAVKAARARLASLRSSGKPEAVLQVCMMCLRSSTNCSIRAATNKLFWYKSSTVR